MDFLVTSKTHQGNFKRKRKQTPLEYMLGVMNDPEVPEDRRDRMAVAAAPYVHPKVIQAARGKKAEKTEAALTAGKGTTWADDLGEIRAQ